MVDQDLILQKERILTSLNSMTLPTVERLLAQFKSRLQATQGGGVYRIDEQPTQEQIILIDIVKALEQRRADLTTKRSPGKNGLGSVSSQSLWIILGVGLLAGYILFKK